MEQWQDAASQQVKLITNRLNELLTKGLVWLHSEFGLDLGLKPELIPPWMVLLAACTGLLFMVALWASLCRAVFKKRPVSRSVGDGIEVKSAVSKPVKSEEPKKKKKKSEKKSQPNGRAIAEPQEEAISAEEIVPPHQSPPPEVKNDKIAETKKSKKKAKQAVKDTKAVTAEGKEPEEGTWETKVSNKEKREQRKKDKSSSDGSASPGGGNTPVSVSSEQPKASSAAPPAPTNQKKKKGDSAKVKVEVIASQAKGNEAVEAAAAPEKAVKVSAHTVASKTSSWTTPRQPAPLWRAGIDESWTVIDRPIPSADLNLASLAGLGVGTGQPQPVNDLPWLSQPRVDDEWSGINGGSTDPSSDWNAPSEVWGNYEEPTPPTQEQTLPEPAKANLIGATDDDDEEKDKGDANTDGGAKTKRKKKKKKKAAEEGGTAGQVEEPVKEPVPAVTAKKQPAVHENTASIQPVKAAAVEARGDRQVKEVISQKPPVTQVPQKSSDGEPTAKQNNLPAPTQQKKAEESQGPKPAKKKKARRET
ncbi:protein LYRIC-like [Melanotaenia boesemani]|uniref:protein LYRIC-like n=1 Tax=Melanotaenia boesemani TaxID=1250792 RepID=UPI001C0480C8|nr:protein LYRIC-like [Melanotaenia boesemani]